MGTIRVEFIPIKKYNLGLLGLDHLHIVFEDETSFVNKQDNWYVLEGTQDGGIFSGELGVGGHDILTGLSAANDGKADADLIDVIGTPESRGSRIVYQGPDAFDLFQTMQDYGQEIAAQEFPYEGYAWPFSPGAIMNSSSVVATLLYIIGIDVNENMPTGIRLSPGTSTLLGTTNDDDITIRNNFTQVAGGLGYDTLRGSDNITWPEKFFGGLDDDTIIWSRGENIVHGGQPRLTYGEDGIDTIDYSGAGAVHIIANKHAMEHKFADFISAFEGGSDQLFSIEAVAWDRTTDTVTAGQGVDLLEKPVLLDLKDSDAGRGDKLGFADTNAPLVVNTIDDTMISIQTAENEGLDAGYWAQSVEWLAGSAGDDRIYAGGSLTYVEGGSGNDIIDGRFAPMFTGRSENGHDIELNGGDGDDVIVSSLGWSSATGGAGADTFVLSHFNVGDEFTTFVIEDATAEDKLYVPYDFFKLERGDFDGSELFQLRGAPFKLTPTNTTSYFMWGPVDNDMTDGYIEFYGEISYTMEGDDLVISLMYGHVEEYERDNGPGEPPGPLIREVVGEYLSETLIRVVDWEDGDLGISFPITFSLADLAAAGSYANYPGLNEAIADLTDETAFLPALDLRPDAHVPLEISGLQPPPAAARTFGALRLVEVTDASQGDDSITRTSGGPFDIRALGGNDTILASDGGDVIDGGSGDDTMSGGKGNDTYFVDSAGDLVVEASRGGFDHVYAAIDYVLSAEIEHLTLLNGAASGTGNALRNKIAGNAVANVLSGGGGDDTLAGNGGSDVLSGGDGSDGYIYELGDGDDRLIEAFSATDEDVIVLTGGLEAADVAYVRDPGALDDLVLRFLGGGSITIVDYFSAEGTIEGIVFEEGGFVAGAQLQALAAGAIVSANVNPLANDDAYLFGGTVLRLPIEALTENDTDGDGDALSIVAISSVLQGTAVLDGNEIVITAPAGASAVAIFDYVVSDGQGGSATARAEITFVENSAPVILSTVLNPLTPERTATGSIVASDADGDALLYALKAGAAPALGSVIFDGEGGFIYTAAPGMSGTDTFTVLVSDGFGASDERTFSVEIAQPNRAPVVTAATLGPVSEDSPATGVIAATDPDGDALTYALKPSHLPSKGSITFAADGAFTFAPNANANGEDSFTVLVTDSRGATTEQSFTFEIAPVNDAPEAADDNGFTVASGDAISIALEELLANDGDADGDALMLLDITSGTGGSVTQNAAGDVVFSAQTGFSGVASFDYRIADPSGAEATATVFVTVTQAPASGLTLTGTNGRDVLRGSAASDTFYGKKGDDRLVGLSGNDTFKITGYDGFDTILGGAGTDVLLGSAGTDVFRVSSNLANLKSVEIIDGHAGFNTILATGHGDVLDFSALELRDIDLIALGEGNDRFEGSSADDVVLLGGGRDTVIVRSGGGHDVVKDFDAGRQSGNGHGWHAWCDRDAADALDVRAFGFEAYSELAARMTASTTGVTITLDATTSIFLEGVRLRDLGADDFKI